MSLQLHNVTKKFGDFTAVHNLSLEINKGDMFGFLGGNGAGKTTTFRMILGLLDESSGEIIINEKSLSNHDQGSIGYLPEERGLYPKLTVQQQIVYLAKLRGLTKQCALQELDVWLDRLDVSHYKKKKVEELSKGNQQKIQFISAVIHDPSLLLLDEPFSGLDPVNVEMLKESMAFLRKQGKTIVFSSHQMSHVEQLCEQICILQKGKSVVQGSLQEIKRGYRKRNVSITADFDVRFLQHIDGVVSCSEIVGGCVVQITEEKVAEQLFTALQEKGTVRQFSLNEPSLHEIFIEKVGSQYE